MSRTHRQQRAFTLIEVIVVAAIFSLAMLSVVQVLMASQRNYNDYTVGTELRDRARAILDRMEGELRETGVDCPDFTVVNGTSTVTFNQCTGFDGADVTWGAPIAYSRTAQGTLMRSQNGTSRILANSVSSLSFGLENGYITIDITFTKNSANGRSITQSFASKVFLRNG